MTTKANKILGLHVKHKKVQVQLWLRDDLNDKAIKHAVKHGISRNEILNIIVEHFFKDDTNE